MTYDKLGLHADAETMFAKARTRIGDRGAFEYSEVYKGAAPLDLVAHRS